MRMVTLIGSTSDMILGKTLEPVPAVARLQDPLRSGLPSGCSSIPSGCQTSNHQSRSSCCLTAFMARRKLSASSIVSCTSARPPGCSIIAAATSQEAMMPYCGEVEVCIMNASLKRVMSSCLVSAFWTWIIDACESAARSLCVDCVAKVIACGDRDGLRRRDGVIAVVELMEVRVGVPGLVEVQHLDRIAERAA